MADTVEERQLVAKAAEEMARHPDAVMELQLNVAAAAALAGFLGLALKHPQACSLDSAILVRRTLHKMQRWFALVDMPSVNRLIELGIPHFGK